jgi:uncharacterized protein YjbJ (UPF0337 family)
MNWDLIKDNWTQVKNQAQQQWSKLTNVDLDVIEGKREALVDKIQERYGISKEQAEREVELFPSLLIIHKCQILVMF